MSKQIKRLPDVQTEEINMRNLLQVVNVHFDVFAIEVN